MARGDSSFFPLTLAALMATAIGYYAPGYFADHLPEKIMAQVKATARPQPAQAETKKPIWAASAPGRVEPAGGEYRLSSPTAGRIVEVLVGMNDKVQAGDLLVRLDDQDYAARVAAAEAEVEVRKRDRDAETVGKLAQDRRAGDDAVASAERQLVQARADFDQALRSRRAGSEADVSKSRDAVKAAQAKVGEARANARKVANGDGMPAQTRPEAALAAARAELSLADAAYERTRIRAPIDATLLQVNAKAGELAAPSIEAPLLVVGDLSSLRVRAEIEERDLPKVRIGQAAIVRSDAFPDREFNGKAVSIAQALGPAKLATRGPRKPTDVDVLEILIDLEGHPPLLPGMRVDVFFKADATVQSNAPGKAN